MKTVLFVPGFYQYLKDGYRKTIQAIEKQGYKVEFVPIKWERTTITDWVAQLNREYQKYDPADVILAGFSFGSLTALLVAAEKNPSELWLLSLSPYFSDDVPKLKPAWLSFIGKNRAAKFRELSFAEIAHKINCPTLIIVGELEAKKYPMIDHRSKVAQKLIKGCRLVVSPDTDHNVTNPKYIKTITGSI